MHPLHTLALATLVIATTCATPALAAPDVKAGKSLHDKQCSGCHVKRWGGDGSEVYTRADRKIKTADALQQRVAMCSTQTGAQFFPDDEANVAAYLAKQYYKFK